MVIMIAGDLVPTEVNNDLFENGNVVSLLGKDLLSFWNSADIRIFNLEVPLVDMEAPIDKYGPNLIASTSTIKGIQALNPSLVTLANNHIMDQGIQGLISTMNILKSYNIPYVGVGENLQEASKAYILEYDGIKIGVYACAEHEFSIATENKPGANPFDPLESPDHVAALKEKCDYVIVLYHGGKEHFRYPSPNLQKVCRKMVEKGADLVICQHSHCIGCYEYYRGSTIIYGQGNFIFNKHDNEFWNTGLIVRLNIKMSFSVDYIPIIRTEKGIRLANNSEEKEIIGKFFERSRKVIDKDFLETQYKKYAEENIDNYLRKFIGFGKWLSRVDKHILRGLLLKTIYNKEKMLVLQNYIECEAHRELIIEGIKSKVNKN